MQMKVNVEISGDQITYILCRYHLKNGTFPKPRNGLFSAIRDYVSVNGAPLDERVEACRDSRPLLYERATAIVEKYFPYSFD